MEFILGKDGEVRIIPIVKGTESLKQEDELYSYLKKKNLFEGNLSEIYLQLNPKEENVLFLGLGEEEELNIDHLRKAFHNVGKKIMEFKIKNVSILIPKFGNLCYKNHSSCSRRITSIRICF